MSESPFRVSITDDYMVDGISIFMALRFGPMEMQMLRFPEGYAISEPVDPAATGNPTMRISHEFGRELRDALNRYYGDTYDDRALRADYKDERRRNDKLTDAIIEIARFANPPRLIKPLPE